MIKGNEFAAPSTASFGESNTGSVEETTGRVQTLVPAVVAPGSAGTEPLNNTDQTMADAIGNATASTGSTPLSYEMVTISGTRPRSSC